MQIWKLAGFSENQWPERIQMYANQGIKLQRFFSLFGVCLPLNRIKKVSFPILVFHDIHLFFLTKRTTPVFFRFIISITFNCHRHTRGFSGICSTIIHLAYVLFLSVNQ